MAARLPALQPLLSFLATLCGLESFWLVRQLCFLGGQFCKTGKSVFILENCSVTFFTCCFFKVVFLRLNILIFPIRYYEICNIIFICKSFLHQIFFCQGSTGSGITESRAKTVFKIPDSCGQIAFQNRCSREHTEACPPSTRMETQFSDFKPIGLISRPDTVGSG